MVKEIAITDGELLLSKLEQHFGADLNDEASVVAALDRKHLLLEKLEQRYGAKLNDEASIVAALERKGLLLLNLQLNYGADLNDEASVVVALESMFAEQEKAAAQGREMMHQLDKIHAFVKMVGVEERTKKARAVAGLAGKKVKGDERKSFIVELYNQNYVDSFGERNAEAASNAIRDNWERLTNCTEFEGQKVPSPRIISDAIRNSDRYNN